MKDMLVRHVKSCLVLFIHLTVSTTYVSVEKNGILSLIYLQHLPRAMMLLIFLFPDSFCFTSSMSLTS